MSNHAEIVEKNYLETVKASLRSALEKIDARVRRYAKDIQEQKYALWDNKADMDHAEKTTVRQAVHMSVLTGEAALAQKERLHKLTLSPYFGRFDFTEQGKTEPLAVYVGIYGFVDEESNTNLVYDWRAPVSTMFYDYETGGAGYTSPSGVINGTITLKRQYRIRKGQMEFMIESDISVMDNVLQEELSRTSDNRMKNIVATIQREDRKSVV